MHNLTALSDSTRHSELAKLIAAFNQILEKDHHLEKIFLLQKINHYLETCIPDSELLAWRAKSGPESLENHMQRFGITRDGSTLVKSLQFASAVINYFPKMKIQRPDLNMDYFGALRARNALLARPFEELDEKEINDYIQYSNIIISTYSHSPNLQQLYKRSQYFLSLCYSKMEAIQGVVDQEFGEFQTKKLGEKVGNNRNFTLNIEGEEKRLVLRVEDRNSLMNEHELQAYPVSQYFSEDYYTIMMPFKEGYLVSYRPVVLSEYVEPGSLDNYAFSLLGDAPDKIQLAIQRTFLQLSEFCIQLMEAGHYHPDIKLSNFLTDGRSIKVSDRKTIIDQINPSGADISVTPTHAPPEYLPCFNKTMTAINVMQASSITLDMPQFMSYQLGMTLKEFIMTSIDIPELTQAMFLNWVPITTILNAPNKAQKNLYALVQELTRNEIKDRLSIANFQSLLSKIHLPHNLFLHEIEKLSPQTQLSNAQELEVFEHMLQEAKFTAKMSQMWQELEISGKTMALISDPRTRFFEFAQVEINAYLSKIDNLIKAENRKKSTSLRSIGSFLRLSSENITVAELPAIPVMPEKIKWYFSILKTLSSPMIAVDDMAKLEHIHQREKGLGAQKTSSPNAVGDQSPTDNRDNNLESSFDERDLLSDSGTFIRKENTDFKMLSDSPEAVGRSPTDNWDNNLESSFDERDLLFDSGTFIRKERPDFQVPPDSPEEVVELDSGTFVKVGNKNSPEFDPGSVVRTPDPKQKDQQSQMKKALKMLSEDASSENDITKPHKATDITTTIQRGNKRS